MKKIISLFLTIVLALSCSIASFAATNDQADDMELEIRQAICDQLLSKYEIDDPYDFFMEIMGTTNDGFTCFVYTYGASPDVVVNEYFGDYKYSYNAGVEFFCYKDGIIYKIKDAYENGTINDNTIADIADMGVDIRKVESPTTPTVTIPEEPTENTQPVTEPDDMELEIRQAICDQLLSEYEIDDPYDFFMEIRGTTSDGFTCFLYIYGGGPDVEINEYFGDYKYSYSFGLESFCYKDGIIYKIKDAYESGVINDNTIAELAGMGLGITKVESPTTPPVTVPEEPAENITENTQPVTETEKNTQPAASTVVNTTDPAENGATDDEAVTPTTANGNNSATPATVNGDAVKTGEPLTAVSILSALIIACAASALILKRKQNIEI